MHRPFSSARSLLLFFISHNLHILSDKSDHEQILSQAKRLNEPIVLIKGVCWRRCPTFGAMTKSIFWDAGFRGGGLVNGVWVVSSL